MEPGATTSTTETLRRHLDEMPLVAILRGVRPDEVVAIATALYEAGFRAIEVPLNSPDPIESVRLLSEAHGHHALVGAGTVMNTTQVDQVADAGGRLVVMPHTDPELIAHARSRNLVCVPGFLTPSEAFAAVRAGADGLKLFPAQAAAPDVLRSMMAVLPADKPVLAIGSINADKMAAYWQAGARGFGIGGAVYRPGYSAEQVADNARLLVEAASRLG